MSPEIYLRKSSKSVQTRISIPVTTSNVPTHRRTIFGVRVVPQYPELALLSFPAKAQVELLESLVRKVGSVRGGAARVRCVPALRNPADGR